MSRRPRILAVLLLGILFGAVEVARAAAITYSDRTIWTTAVGGAVQTEDFDSFLTDTEFRTVAVSILNGSISQIVGPPASGANGNLIDASPFVNAGFSVNGSTHVRADVGGANGAQFQIAFTQGVSAWGADFYDINSANTVMDIFDASNTLIGTSLPLVVGFQPAFWGFHLNAGEVAARIVFRGPTSPNDVLFIDNASFVASSASTVPEPTSLLLLGPGLMAAARRVRRRRVN